MISSSLRHTTQRHLQSRRHCISGSSLSIRKRSSRVSRSIFNHHGAINSNINARFISRAGTNFCDVNIVCKRGRNYNAGAMQQSNNHVLFSTSSSSDLDVNELSKLTVNELRDKLKEKGLPVSGVKTALVERLVAAGSKPQMRGMMSDTGVETDMTRNELRDKLREKGLPVSGLKDELVERLAATGSKPQMRGMMSDTGVETDTKAPPIVISPADDIDYEIYSSPQALLMKRNIRNLHEIEC